MASANSTAQSAPKQDLKASGIYSITCLPTGKIYIGSAKCLGDRWRSHRSQLRLGSHCNAHLQSSWNKYGEDAFEFKIAEHVEINGLIGREQFWIDLRDSSNHKSGFNICPKAYSRLGTKNPGLSAANRARALPPEIRAEREAARYAAKLERTKAANRARTAERGDKRNSPESRAKIANAMKVRVLSLESREKISRSLVGYFADPKARARISESHSTPEAKAALAARNRGDKQRTKVSAALKGREFTPESRARMSASRVNLAPEDAAKAKRLLAEGWTGRNVAKHFGVSACTISNIKNDKIRAYL